MLVSQENQSHRVSKTDYGMVSIIMPNYNSEKYIEETIKSVLAQTYNNWELLFVDDLSTDNSLELVHAFDDDRIKVFTSDKNGGAAIARNKAIENARGRWIAFLDSDDLWLPDKLEKQIKYMLDNDFSFSFTDYDVVGENNEQIFKFVPHLDSCTYNDILKHNHIGCLTVIYDAEKLGRVYMPTNAEKREDLACWLSILKRDVKGQCLHESLSKYKIHSNSVSSKKSEMIKYQWRVYRNVEHLSVIKSVYYLAHWAILGVLKYR